MFKRGFHSPRDIREALTGNRIQGTDKRARFVTVAAYEAAGGIVERDLFAEGDAGAYLLDAQLLDRLALEKLAAEAETVKAEGWKWVEVHAQIDRSEMDFRRRGPSPLPLSEELQAERRTLSEKYSTLFDSTDEPDEAACERLDAIERRIEEIEDSAELAYTPETLSIAGAILTIGYNGEPEIIRGLVKPEDEPEADETDEPSKKKARPEYSAKLLESLTAARSAAIGASLSDNPSVALAAVVHGLAMSVFDSYGPHGHLQLHADVMTYKEDTKGACELKSAYARWSDQLPGDEADLLAWCLEQDRETLLSLLAFCAGCMVNAVWTKHSDTPDAQYANALATALHLDMSEWFTPTAENFFRRVGRHTIVDAITQAKGVPAKRSWQKMKKAELAALAERETSGTGWLPQPLAA